MNLLTYNFKIFLKELNHDFVKQAFSLHSAMSILFILMPIALVTGPFLPDLFLSLIALYFLVTSIKKKLFKFYTNKFFYIFFTFCIYLIISGLISKNPIESLIASNGPIFYFRYIFFILGVWYLIETNPRIIKYFTLILFLVITAVIFDGLLQWQLGVSISGYFVDKQHGGRVTGIFGEEQILGHFLSHVVPLCFALMVFLFKKNKKTILVFFIFLVVSEVFIFITNDRAAFLKIFQFTLLLIFLSNKFKLARLISFSISSLFIAILLTVSPDSKGRYINQTISEISQTKIPYMPWTPLHEKHYSLALNLFVENPITGGGPQSFRFTCKEYPFIEGCTNHPHNYYFQTLAELGLIGLSFLSLGFLYVGFLLIKQFFNIWLLKSDKFFVPDHIIALYSVIFIFMWPLIPNASFYNNWLNVMLFLPVPFLLYFLKKT